MSVQLQGIEVFVAVVEAGNFSVAAERLKLTRSAVSKGIARLEDRLRVKLFHRTTRSHRLTPEGQAYYDRCRRVLDELAAAGDELEAGRRDVAGLVRMTAPVIIGRVLLAPLLLRLGEKYPGLEIEVVFTDLKIDIVQEGIDLAVRSGRLADSATLASRTLGRQVVAVYASPAYLSRHPRPASYADLLAQRDLHEYVGLTRRGRRLPWHFVLRDVDKSPEAFDFQSRFACDALDVVVQAAVAGYGMVRVPVWLASSEVEAGRLVKVFDEPCPFGYELSAVWPATRTLPMKQRIVLDALVASFPAHIDPLAARKLQP